MDCPIEALDQKLQYLDAYSAHSHRETLGTQQEHPAHHLGRKQRSYADRVGHDEVPLQFHHVFLRYSHVREPSEAGVDPVDGFVALQKRSDERPARSNALARRIGQCDPRTVTSHGHYVGQRQWIADSHVRGSTHYRTAWGVNLIYHGMASGVSCQYCHYMTFVDANSHTATPTLHYRMPNRPKPQRGRKTPATKKAPSRTGVHRARAPRGSAPSASATAYAHLREQIIDCARAPGERLTESEVATQMHLGKTPVREALRQLVHEGLVVVHPRRGYVVAPVTLSDVEDLCGLRLIVEPAAVALAAEHMDDDVAAALEKLCHIGYEVSDPESVRAFHRVNRSFHSTIARACGNPRLAALIDQLLVESQRIIQFGMLLQPHSDEAVHSHEALLDALKARNASAARRIVAQEIRDTQRMVIDGLLRHSTLRTLEVDLPRGHAARVRQSSPRSARSRG